VVRRHPQTRYQLLLLFALAGTAGPSWAATYTFDTNSQYLTRADNYPRWAALMRRHARQSVQLEACLNDVTRCPSYLRGYREIVLRSKALSPYRRMLLANRFINSRRWRVEPGHDDEWRTLTDFLHHGGDCEDYAIAKYFVLRRLGFAVDDLRIGIGRETTTRDYHAVTMVRLDGQVYVLDVDGEPSLNQFGYRLLFSINEKAIWDHERPRTIRASDKQEGNPL
jgi:predicted transglutaminase-like cysteine proteinase